MPTYGLTTEGFLAKTLDIIRTDFIAALQSAFGATIRTDDQSVLGQLIGIFAERLALLWELAEVTNTMMDPDAATGSSLEQLCLLTGTLRPSATFSAVNLTLTGTAATVIPSGTSVKTATTDAEFKTNDSSTLVAVDPWATNTPYVIGDRVTNNDSATSKDIVWECSVAGTSALVGTGPATTFFVGDTWSGGPTSDGSVTWILLGEGVAAADVTAAAVQSGIVPASAYDLSEIVNPISGWDDVTNPEDAIVGREIATDAELRLLREQELATGGSSPLNALRAELLRIPDVASVSIFQNVDDTTDADGLPPHSVEALVRGPSASPSADFDQSIWDALLAGVAAGIKTASASGGTTVVGTAIDDEQTAHTMTFSRPTEKAVNIIINLIVDTDAYPDDGDDLVKSAIATWGGTQATGKDVVSSRISAAAFDVDGVLDVTSCLIAFNPTTPTVGTTLAISKRQLATYSTTDITVVTTPGTP